MRTNSSADEIRTSHTRLPGWVQALDFRTKFLAFRMMQGIRRLTRKVCVDVGEKKDREPSMKCNAIGVLGYSETGMKDLLATRIRLHLCDKAPPISFSTHSSGKKQKIALE